MKSLDELQAFSPELLSISIYPDEKEFEEGKWIWRYWVIDITPFHEKAPKWPWKFGLAGYGDTIEEAIEDVLKSEMKWRK